MLIRAATTAGGILAYKLGDNKPQCQGEPCPPNSIFVVLAGSLTSIGSLVTSANAYSKQNNKCI